MRYTVDRNNLSQLMDDVEDLAKYIEQLLDFAYDTGYDNGYAEAEDKYL